MHSVLAYWFSTLSLSCLRLLPSYIYIYIFVLDWERMEKERKGKKKKRKKIEKQEEQYLGAATLVV
jgi:hypothetical protein